MDLQRLYNNINSLDVVKLAMDIIDKEFKGDIADLNRDQLLSGKGSDNDSLPKYVDDPYFKTKEAALRYQAWKSKISPNSKKDPAVMDFYINGRFHSTIFAKLTDKSIILDSNSSIKGSVLNKTNGAALGLNDESIEIVQKEVLPLLIDEIYTQILK